MITFILHCSGGSVQCNKARKLIKCIITEKEKTKLSLFINGILFVENTKESTDKLSDLV